MEIPRELDWSSLVYNWQHIYCTTHGIHEAIPGTSWNIVEPDIRKLGRCWFDQAELIRSQLNCNDCPSIRKQNKAISTIPSLPCYEQLKKFCSPYFQSFSISATIITLWSSLIFSFQSDFWIILPGPQVASMLVSDTLWTTEEILLLGFSIFIY